NMANDNVPALVPIRSDDQILPFVAWVPIRKSKFVFDLQKKQKNPIFQISVDILQNINFFRAFTASASVPAIYIQQEALEITPIDQAHQFVSPPSGDAIMDFVNELGYTKKIHFVSRMAMNNLYQPWRAILSMINQCLTGKTSGFDRPRYPVLQMLWGIITSTNVDYAELMYEEFVQAIQTFLTDKANLGSPTKKGRKAKPHIIPYCRFTKLIICHLGRRHNLHQRSESSLHLAEEDLRLGNLKFVPKGKADEVFGMPIPNELQKMEEKKKTATAKQLKPNPVKEKSSKPAPAPKPKVKPAKPSPIKHSKIGKVQKIRKGKSSLQLIDENEPTQPEPEPEPEPEHQGGGEEYDVQRAIQMSLESFQSQSQAHVGEADTEEASTRPSAQPQDDASTNIVRESLSHADAKKDADTDKTNSGEEKTAEIDEGQAGSDPSKTSEFRPLPDDDKMD
ncbi:hypothetical protein Tco_1290449, partial [Tanacetum coccineum]